MATVIRWTNASGRGDLVLDADNRITEGDPIVANIFASLYIDAAPDEGDPVPSGVTKPGYWATAFDDGAINGSKLWLVRYIRPIATARLMAAQYVSDALRWMVDAGELASVTATARLDTGKLVIIDIAATLADGTRRTFRADITYAI